MEHLEAQKAEVNELRSQLQEANRRAMEANEVASTRLQQALEEERENAEADRADLLSQIKLLIEDSGQKQAARLKSRVDGITSDMASSGEMLEQASNVYHERMKEWTRREDQLIEEVASSRDTIENRMEKDWNVRFVHANIYLDETLTISRFLTSATHRSKGLQSLSTRRLSGLWMLRCKAWLRRWKHLTTSSRKHDLKMASITRDIWTI